MLCERRAAHRKRCGGHIAYHAEPLREESAMLTDPVILPDSNRFETRRTVFVNLKTAS
jgi:hypothetical protein